jgi:hypothetical protein
MMDVSFITTGRNDRIILYRQDGVVPAFALNPIDSYKYEYEHCTTFSGFDFNLHKTMDDEDFSLLPKTNIDDDIEYWVKGFIFGFIKYSEDKYWYQDWKNGRALDDYWISIGAVTRDQAYEEFKRNISLLRQQYADKIEEKIKTGSETVTELVNRVRGHYFDEFSQCEVSKETIRRRGYEKVAALMEEELQYVERKLSALLDY